MTSSHAAASQTSDHQATPVSVEPRHSEATSASALDRPAITGSPKTGTVRSVLHRTALGLGRLPAHLCIACIRCYQLLLSPLLGRHCRFHPSCSAYGIQAIRKYGCVRGVARTFARICRCHPWHPGGYDPP